MKGPIPDRPDEESPGTVVKALVHRIPIGKASTYGAIGRAASALGRPIGGARTVAWILASLKGTDDTPWHRVVGASGVILLPDRRGATQRSRLQREGVRFVKGKLAPSLLMDEGELLTQRKRRRSVSAAR